MNSHKPQVVGDIDGSTINNDGFLISMQIIMCDEAYNLLTARNRYSEDYPILKVNADYEEFEEWMDN